MDIARILRERRGNYNPVLVDLCICIAISLGGLELEGVEVRVQINDKNKTEVDDLIPKQVTAMYE